MATITKPNVAVVEQDGSDGITITLLGVMPANIAPRHHFQGTSLKQIEAIMVRLGVHVLVWLVKELPAILGQSDLLLVQIGYAVAPTIPADKPLAFSP